MDNKDKAKELAIKYCKDIDSNGKECYNIGCEIACNEMAQWKDEQHKKVINTIKANIIEARDNKEYYQANREITLNWILRLIDECYENV